MKKITTTLFILLISFCFILSGCGEKPLTMPENYNVPVSNGGFVVGAGNYMYFSNAFKGYSELTTKNDNNGKKVAEFSLKRLEVETSKTWLKTIKNEDEEYNYENVANKIAGYETSNMYVVNDYLYFTSPNVHKNKENEYEFNLTTLFRIKLDGTGLTEIYTTKTATSKFYLEKNNVLLIFDDNKISSVNLNNNSASLITLAENVENVVFPEQEEQEIDWLYFTAKRDEESMLSGNILNKVNINTKRVEENIYSVNGQTITIIGQEGETLFYIRSGSSNDGLFSNNFSTSSSEIRHRTLTDGITDKTFAYIECENSDYNAYAFIYNNNLYIQLASARGDAESVRKISTETTTIQFINKSYIYFSTDKGIYRYSVFNMGTQTEEVDSNVQQISNLENMDQTKMDFDGRYVYFFAKTENQASETKYLHRADCYSEEILTECLAEVPADDVKEETEETEE